MTTTKKKRLIKRGKKLQKKYRTAYIEHGSERDFRRGNKLGRIVRKLKRKKK